MDCCGRSRAAGRPGAPPAVRGAAGRGAAARRGPAGGGATSDSSRAGSSRVVGGPVPLRWRRRVAADVIGPATGRTYAVSAQRPVVVVDPSDAAGLLATGFFDRVG